MLNLTPSETRTIFIISGVLILAGLFYVAGSYVEKPITIDYSESDSIFSRLTHQVIPIKRDITGDDHITLPVTQTHHPKTKSEDRIAKGSININVADASTLKKLPRIGPAMANRIIEYRKINGPFSSREELTKVKGIGKKTFKLIKPFLCDIP